MKLFSHPEIHVRRGTTTETRRRPLTAMWDVVDDLEGAHRRWAGVRPGGVRRPQLCRVAASPAADRGSSPLSITEIPQVIGGVLSSRIYVMEGDG